MSKFTFWIMIGLWAVVFIYIFKTVAAQTNIPSLKSFAGAV